jgi:hypothetical protein
MAGKGRKNLTGMNRIKNKDEGGRMKAEGAMKSCFSFILLPSSFRLAFNPVHPCLNLLWADWR